MDRSGIEKNSFKEEEVTALASRSLDRHSAVIFSEPVTKLILVVRSWRAITPGLKILLPGNDQCVFPLRWFIYFWD